MNAEFRAFAESHGSPAEATAHLEGLLEGRFAARHVLSPVATIGLSEARAPLDRFLRDFQPSSNQNGDPYELSILLIPESNCEIDDADKRKLGEFVRASPAYGKGLLTEAIWLQVAGPWLRAVGENLPITWRSFRPVLLSDGGAFAGDVLMEIRTILMRKGALPDGDRPFTASVAWLQDLRRSESGST